MKRETVIVLDFGNRIIDISTILQLCEYFNIPLQTVNRVSRNYVNQILHTVKTSETYYTNYVQTEHQYAKLVIAGELLDIFVTTVFPWEIVEIIAVEEV